ncbi:MAG: 50S ribosomal protein L23 [Bulleidia sp.]
MSARDIIIRPVVTEKSNRLQETENKVTFVVAKNANKVAIKQAIQEIYNIKPVAVNTINVHPKKKRVGRFTGMTSAYKKAVVTLPEGQTIELYKED